MASSDGADERRLQELLSDDGQWKMYETWQAKNPEYPMPPKWRQYVLELADLRAKIQASTFDEPRGAEKKNAGSPSTQAPSPSSKTQSPSSQTQSASATQGASPTRSASPTSRTRFLDSTF